MAGDYTQNGDKRGILHLTKKSRSPLSLAHPWKSQSTVNSHHFCRPWSFRLICDGIFLKTNRRDVYTYNIWEDMLPSKCRGISPAIFFLRKSIISEFCQKAASRVVPATATAIFARHFERHDGRSKITDIWISAIKFSSDSSHIAGDRLVCPLPRKSLAINFAATRV